MGKVVGIAAPVVVAVGVVIVAFLIVTHEYSASHASQPAQQPQPPATVTYDGKTYDCAQVRQAWNSGNMDEWDSYPAAVGTRCLVP